jgi:small subunit ribosomal protein S15
MVAKEVKEKLIKVFGKSSSDVGSCEVQIALLSERIRQVSEHLKIAKKDFHSQLGLLRMVGKRRAFLNYLKENQTQSYEKVLKSLKEHGYT